MFAELPYNDYFEYYGPDFKLHISPSNMANQNTPEYLDKIKARLFENMRMLPHAPGVQMTGTYFGFGHYQLIQTLSKFSRHFLTSVFWKVQWNEIGESSFQKCPGLMKDISHYQVKLVPNNFCKH